MTDNNHEHEVKLIGDYNNQLKYVDGFSYKNALDKIRIALRILGISCSPFEREKNIDDYYDTSDFQISRGNCSLRVRRQGEATEITLKTDPQDTGKDGLGRTEFKRDVPREDLEQELQRVYQEHFSPTAVIQHKLTVINDRHKAIITTSMSEYELSLDKYQYHSRMYNYKSDDYYEIEIESTAPLSQPDPGIHRLSDVITKIFNFTLQAKSKYDRGIEWLCCRDEMKQQGFLMFDISGYSLNNPTNQKILVQRFNALAEDALNYYDVQRTCIKIPTGDGMILGFGDGAPILLILQKIYQDNSCLNQTTYPALEFCTAIHWGPVFTYQDINHNINYAGDGINCVARICSQAEKWQVLVSEEYYDWNDSLQNLSPLYFSDPFSITVKHGRKIDVRNYCQPGSGPGIPLR